jgi:hypothetical protein
MLNFTPRRTLKPEHSKKIPVQPSLYKDTHNKLLKLAISCNMSKTAMAEKIINMAVNHPDIINHFQELYNTEPSFRIKPLIDGERVDY